MWMNSSNSIHAYMSNSIIIKLSYLCITSNLRHADISRVSRRES